MKSNALRLSLSVALLLILLIAVQLFVGWGRLLGAWQQVPPIAFIVSVLLVLASYLLRAARVHDYFSPATRGRYWRCLGLTLQHNALNNLMPMRSGELSFPVLMKRHFSLSMVQTGAGLMWFRLLDLHSLLLVGGVALVLTGALPGPLLLLVLPWMLLPFLMVALRQPLQQTLQARLPETFHTKLNSLMSGLPASRTAVIREWLWTLLNWSMKLFAYAWILGQFLPGSGAAAWLGAVGGELSSVLPIHGVAGAGSYEAGVAAALLPFRLNAPTVLAAAVNLHLFVLVLASLAGVLAFMFDIFSSKRQVADV